MFAPNEDQKVRKAIITDAGFASRYLPVTKTLPKAMGGVFGMNGQIANSWKRDPLVQAHSLTLCQ